MIYKLRLPLHLQPLRQPQHKQYTRTRMLKLRPISTQVTPGAANSTLDVKIMARKKRESDRKKTHTVGSVALSWVQTTKCLLLPSHAGLLTVRCFLHVFIFHFCHDIYCCFFTLIQVVLFILPVQLTPNRIGKPYPVDVESS